MSHIEFAPYRHLRSLACALTLAAAALLTGSMRESSAASPMAGASEWSPGLHAAMRLLDGGPDDRSGRTFKAGVEIRLDPHFKTYWRTPGDSGIPPVFEWSQSQNVANVEVLWPAPYRFEDTAGASIGYKDRVIFPIKVTAADPKRPVVLVLQLDYAVCEKICIPVKGEARLTLASAGLSTHNSMAVADAEARVPTPARVGDNTPPAIRFIGIASGGKGLLVDALVPDAAKIVDIFAEGPDGWVFAAPTPISTMKHDSGARMMRYRIGVDEMPKGAELKGLQVQLTMTADDAAVEMSVRLDAGPPAP